MQHRARAFGDGRGGRRPLVRLGMAAIGLGALVACQTARDPHAVPAPTSHAPAHAPSTAPTHAPTAARSRPTPSQRPSDRTAERHASVDPPPARRIVAYYGAGGTPALGVLGQGSSAAAWARLTRQAAAYARPGTAVVPAFELVAVLARASPGGDGTYRQREPAEIIDRYLAEARRHHGLLILDVQPGRSDFLTEAMRLEPWLAQPEVGLALDPEWRMGAAGVPGRAIGSVSAREVNEVSGWLDRLTARLRLPRKVFVVHRFTTRMVRGEASLVDRRHLDEIMNIDGFGTPREKLKKYRRFARTSPFPLGLKLFYRQDSGLLPPAQVLALEPPPAMVDYQ